MYFFVSYLLLNFCHNIAPKYEHANIPVIRRHRKDLKFTMSLPAIAFLFTLLHLVNHMGDQKVTPVLTVCAMCINNRVMLCIIEISVGLINYPI